MSNQYNKYNNSKIYKIWSPQTDLIYIGSTTQILCKRLADHKSNYKSYKEGKFHYVSSFKILEYGDAKIELIKEVNCQNREQLNSIEGDLQREYRNVCINIRIEGRTQQEYYEEHKEDINDRHKKYYEEHKEDLKESHKKYYEEHKEDLKEKVKIYRNNNKEQILQNKAKLYNCICGVTCRYGEKARHFKTKKHQSYMNDTLFNLLDL
jgi:hypothetical protein